MDQHQRELERKASAGDVEAEAKLLVARLRSGELSEAQLEIAAYLGAEGAALALGDEAPEVLTADDLPDYHLRVDQVRAHTAGYLEEVAAWWGQEFCMRFAIVAARFAAENWRSRKPAGEELYEASQACLAAAEAWVADSTLRSPLASRMTIPHIDSENSLSLACRGLNHIAGTRAGGSTKWRDETLSEYLARTVLASTRILTKSKKAQRRDREILLGLVRDELVPWALGTGDPVRDRVEARKREAAE